MAIYDMELVESEAVIVSMRFVSDFDLAIHLRMIHETDIETHPKKLPKRSLKLAKESRIAILHDEG
ncbi:hypothetical protein [Arabidopsis thaliana]|uniref:Uncharacterized protein F18N11.10 n=1 Tax=Arabidopsis thaliana TaxID=3702 RepID=Q9M3F2_ARATH|nr:hypothetical protein [Arabidopsis thaliana]